MPALSIQQHIAQAAEKLSAVSDSPTTDAEWLALDLLKIPKAQLVEIKNEPPPAEFENDYAAYIQRRLEAEPVQYITGSTYFYNTHIVVGPGVLIPRPETEILIEELLKLLPKNSNVLDLCTGSGCILFAIATEIATVELTGTDISDDALSWARKNARALNLPEIRFLKGSLFEPVAGEKFDIISANPPYISPGDYDALSDTVKSHEPQIALQAADEGLAVYKEIIEDARKYLVDEGWLILEIGETQADAISTILEQHDFKEIKISQDFTGRDRIIIAQ
ncbi:MAG: peptide chain release factor N(5)-glutamine methyltransferase [Lentisphaeria bacterium]|nr:peptide chain release factor N(5)-glutamine methyltransferase [Lentisphaeria bacterium]NQZ68712.1 peptide chain release factor N(5)-glutamine methyltransferase [Lentisphaeria bacterium]